LIFLLDENEKIMAFYSGNISQIDNMKLVDPISRVNWVEIIMQDDEDVISNPSQYEFINGELVKKILE